MEKPLVSIIIPTFNSEKTLTKCLESIKNQSYKNIEIIVIDNYSGDRTSEIAKSFGVQVYSKGPERSSQRNFGAKLSIGKYLLFIDSDHLLDYKLIDECILAINKNNSDALIIPNYSIPANNFWSRCFSLEKRMYDNDKYLESTRFLKKEIFNKIGGYNEKLVAGEDYDLHARVLDKTNKIHRINSVIWHLGEKITLKNWIKKHMYYSNDLLKYLFINPRRASRQFMPFRSAFIRNYKLLLSHPIEALGMLFLFWLKYFAVLVGIMFFSYRNFIKNKRGLGI